MGGGYTLSLGLHIQHEPQFRCLPPNGAPAPFPHAELDEPADSLLWLNSRKDYDHSSYSAYQRAKERESAVAQKRAGFELLQGRLNLEEGIRVCQRKDIIL